MSKTKGAKKETGGWTKLEPRTDSLWVGAGLLFSPGEPGAVDFSLQVIKKKIADFAFFRFSFSRV